MKRVLPNRPGRLMALLGLFLAFAITGWSANSRVWVQYAPGAKGPVIAALAKAGGHVHYEFDNINAVAVTLPEQALAGISHNPSVALVEEDPVRVMSSQTVPYGVEMVQAYPAPASPATGAGITIGVIDSGVYRDHTDLPKSIMTGYPDYGANDERTWYRDFDSHGTHVVGTICAVSNNEGVIGVAPGVGHIYMVKVFGDTGNWVYSSTLLAAVQNAVNSGGAKIISMSLGGGSKSKTEENGLNSIYNGGVLLIAAAGNAGDTTTSYPAGYSSVVSVAAIDINKAVADFSQKNSTVELSAPGVGVLSTVSYVDTTTVSTGGTNYNARIVEFASRGSVTAPVIDGGDGSAPLATWAGKIVFIRRGTLSFYNMAQNVKSTGGVGLIIANNVAGDLYATLGDGNSSTLVCVGVTQTDGALIVANAGSNATLSSVFTQPTSGYDYFDGTSMATPHVSAVAALVWSSKLGATNKQVRQALTESAQDLGTAGRDNSYGYGLVQTTAAITRLAAIVGGGGGGGTGDTTPPVISNVSSSITNSKNGSFQISWITNEPSTSSVTIGSTTSTSSTLVTSHVVSFRGTKGATYIYSVSSKDAAGNVASAGPFTHQN